MTQGITKFFFDTEFVEKDGKRELLSLGIVREDGDNYYAEVEGVDLASANSFVQTQVAPILTGPQKSKDQIRKEVLKWIIDDGNYPEWWGYYCTWDFVLLIDLFDNFSGLRWNKWCNEIMQLRSMVGKVKLPKQTSQKHHALHDAIWTKQCYDHLWGYYTRMGLHRNGTE